MARSKLKAETFIKLDNGQEIPWYTVYADGTVAWHLPQEEGEKYKKKMMERVGRNMSDYINNHPEASLWGKTNGGNDDG